MSETAIIPATAPDHSECRTRREIEQQPDTLLATQALLRERREEIERFLEPLLALSDLRIVLTGAGTSAFIGECLAPWLSHQLGRRVEAVATTDIVSTPDLYCDPAAPTLLVSFGRSGSSPESVAAVRIADARISKVSHLIVTCNADGELAQEPGENTFVVVLPEATHDLGFAMTSSFSAMMLAALAIFSGIGEMDRRVTKIAAAVRNALADTDTQMRELAARGFSRVVYLGSGVFKGLAREAALKLLELSDGQVVSAFDTPMGFRHGPKTIVNGETMVVVFVSNDAQIARYDRDLIAELRADGVADAVVTVAANAEPGDTVRIAHLEEAGDADLLFPYVAPAQLFALAASLALGMNPDKPNASGIVNRIVQGVRIHPFAGA